VEFQLLKKWIIVLRTSLAADPMSQTLIRTELEAAYADYYKD
jgi:hypothetical protein